MSEDIEIIDLGFANAWGPAEAQFMKIIQRNCARASHRTTDKQKGQDNESHHVVECKQCGWRYHYDCSD